MEEDATFEFGVGEDAPMCLDVHPTVSFLSFFVKHPLFYSHVTQKPYVVTGVNSSLKVMMDGENKNCRLFKISNDK